MRKNASPCESTDDIIQVENTCFIKLNWHNAMFFSEYAITQQDGSSSNKQTFICRFHAFRKRYIKMLMKKASESKTIRIDRIGSESCVSDVDISICPEIQDISALNIDLISNIVNAVSAMYKMHHMNFTESFEDMFDTNVYATSLSLEIDTPNSLDTQYVHSIGTKRFVKVIEQDAIKQFNRYQTVMAFQRLYQHRKDNLLSNVQLDKLKSIAMYVEKCIQSMINTPTSKGYYCLLEAKFKELYPLYTGKPKESISIDIIKEYSLLISNYYSGLYLIFKSNERIVIDKNELSACVPNYMSLATLLEQDSYRSMGAFLDIVALSNTNKVEYLTREMLDHSIFDNLGFIVDILKRHEGDGCYDVVTNILKISKYIERICNTIKLKSQENSVTPIDSIKEIAGKANNVRKSVSKNVKRETAALELI